MSRPAPRTARATLSGLAASLVVGLVATLSLGGLDRPRARRERGHPRRLHRLRLRPVPRPLAGGDGPLAHALAVPRGGHLHLRRLAGLPQPAEPHPRVGRAPSCATAGACCRSRSAPRPRASRGSRATATTRRSRPRPATTAATPPPAARAAPRPSRPSPPPGRSASSRAARCGTTSRASTPRSPTAASPRWPSSAPGPGSCTRSGTSRASTPAPARASRCSTTPG